jgi:seryl-tRNA synthetase
MHDIKWIRENADAFSKALGSRNWPEAKVAATLAELIGLDDRRRQAIMIAQRGQEERNALSKQIGQAMGKKDMALADSLKARVAQLKDDLAAAEADEKIAVAELDRKLLELPNLPLSIVPIGADEHDNVEQRMFGHKPVFPAGFKPKEHFEVGETLGLMDFEAASRMSGARFVVLKGALARLQRALGQFMLDLHVDVHGYTEIDPPVLVRDQAMFGTAQLPKFREDQFSVHAGLVQEDGTIGLAEHDNSGAGTDFG